MPDEIDDLIKHARELGKKIAAHPRTREFLAAARAVAEDKEAQNHLKSYQDAITRIRTLEAQGKPVEPDDKRKAADAERQVAGNEKLKSMMKTQVEYLELMNRVNSAIEEQTQGE